MNHNWRSLVLIVICIFQFIITPSSSANINFESAMQLRRRKLQNNNNNNNSMTIPPFALEFGHIITSVINAIDLLNGDQVRNLQRIIQSALNDFLTETTTTTTLGDDDVTSYYSYTPSSITDVQYTTATFLTQSIDLKLQPTFCLTPQDCEIQSQILGGTKSVVEGDYPFKGCLRRKDNLDGTVLFGTGGSVEEMMDVVLNDNLERVFCYKRVNDDDDGDELVRRKRRLDGNTHNEGQSNSHLRRLSVQSAMFTVIVTGAQVVPNSGQKPTESELRESILAQIGSDGGSVLAAKVRELASFDFLLASIFGEVDTVLIPEDQPSFLPKTTFIEEDIVSETIHAVWSCPRQNVEPRDECLAKEQPSGSGLTIHCCRGTLGSNLECKRRCQVRDSYAEAEAFCVNKGMRLCTVPEINSNACCDQGCGFNNKLTWTSSACAAGDDPALSESSSIEMMETTSPTSPPTTSSPTRGPSASPTMKPTASQTPPPTSSSPTREQSASPTMKQTASQTSPPTTSAPTREPSASPTLSPSASPTRKPSTSPTIPPTAAATSLSPAQDTNPCPAGQCLNINGECRVEVRCFMDSCDSNPCNEDEACTPNYCGGCDRICSALAINPSPTSSPPTSASPETPTYSFTFAFPTLPPNLSEAPTPTPSMSPIWPTYSPSVDPDPPLPATSFNQVQSGPGSDGIKGKGKHSTDDTMIIIFASAGSLVIALAVGLGFFAVRKHKNQRQFEDKDPSALETTFNQSDVGEEDIENYNYDENAEFYPASRVDMKYNSSNPKKSLRTGVGPTVLLSRDQPLSCQDGNGMNAAPIDEVVDDLALDFLAGTGNSKKLKDKIGRDFRPKILSAVAPFKPFQGDETEDDSSGEISRAQDGNTAPDFRPKLMDTSFEALQGEDIDVSSEQSSQIADPKGVTATELASNQYVGQKKEEVTAPYSPHRPDPDSHLILSNIYEAAKKSRWEREEKNQVRASTQKVNVPTNVSNDKLARDLRLHRAKMNSFLDEDAGPDLRRGATESSKISNPLSLPQRDRATRNIEDDDSDLLKDFSFSYTTNDDEPKELYQSKKKYPVPPRFAKRNKNMKKSRHDDAEPDQRFFTFDGDNDESDDNEDKSRIPNLITADDTSGLASAVSSIGQLDWRGRERTDRRVRIDSRKKQRELSVDTIETDEAGAKLVACQNTLHKTKNILTETLERSLHCKSRVVSPTSDVNDDDEDSNDQVARPWEAKWDCGIKGKDPPVVEDAGYQSSNYDPDSDWDVEDNDLTVDYSAEGCFMPSPLKGVGFDLKR
eukprot:scaffold844_cov142-Skeletonema_menzelii.AAC.6